MRAITALVWITIFLLSQLLSAQPTTWRALADRIPGGLDEHRLRHLEQDWQVEAVEPNLLKMTHKLTGMVKYVDITNHTVDFNKLAANPNVQVIDLTNVDTTLYNWKYRKQEELLLVIGDLGYPIVIDDLNGNAKLDFSGEYKININSQPADAATIEFQNDSISTLQKIYTDSTVVPIGTSDMDNDGLNELNFLLVGGKFVDNFESSHQDSFPELFTFRYPEISFNTGIFFPLLCNLDDDEFQDAIFVAGDTSYSCIYAIYISEYDDSIGVMRGKRKLCPTDWYVSGFSIEDFDQDNFLEFSTGSISGHINVFENLGNDNYQMTFSDTISAPNAYLNTKTNDINNNGKPEFFIGGSAFYNGVPASRIYWFEASGNNTYQKVRSIFLLGTDVLGTTELYAHDVNGDGIDDLVFSFSFSVVILIWNNSNQQFDLFYYDFWENFDQEIQSISVYDLLGNGIPDLFVSVVDIGNPPMDKSFHYRYSEPTGIVFRNKDIYRDFELEQNFPNPFNGSTIIPFSMNKTETITLVVYDITGKEVIKPVKDQLYNPGHYKITWDGKDETGKEVSSGIYFIMLKSRRSRQLKKMLFIQ